MMSLPNTAARKTVHLWISLSIMLVLSAYRLASTFFHQLETFFLAYTQLPIAKTVTNLLFFWLLGLLWLAYRRWKNAIVHKHGLERVLASISPDSIAVITRKRIITMCSGQIESMFGYSHKELVGKSTDVLYYDRRLRGERGEITKRLEEFGYHVGYASGKRQDGTVFPLEIITGTIKHGGKGAVLLMRDITERCNTEDALRESEARFELFMRYLPGYAFVKDADGRYVYMNPNYQRIYGWNIEESLGKTDFDLFPAELAEQFSKSDTRILKDDCEINYVTRMVHKDEPHSMLTYKFRIPTQGRERPMLGGITLDITDQEKAEEERRKIETQMQQAQKLESLGVLGGGIAHDFNNLLMGMLGHAELALSHLPENDAARQNIEEVIASAQRAADLANQLLAYSGKGQFIVETVSLSQVIEEMRSLFRVSISKKASLRLDLDPNIPAVKCDTTQIRQVIMNLIVNASDALDDASGRITIATGASYRQDSDSKDSYLGTRLPQGQYVYVRISDTGCGMDEATRASIFDPFFTTKFAGRGLGLAAVMGIVHSHKGAISLESTEGKGTTFTVYFPATDESLVEPPTTEAQSDSWQGSGSVLVADDEPTVRDVARMMLENIGFEVVMVNNGIEAVDTFTENPGRFKAVLLDLTMPKLGGFEAYQKIRAIDALMPIVLSSGYNKQHTVDDIQDIHPPVFLKKPYRLDSIRRIFKATLKA